MPMKLRHLNPWRHALLEGQAQTVAEELTRIEWNHSINAHKPRPIVAVNRQAYGTALLIVKEAEKHGTLTPGTARGLRSGLS